MNIIGILCYNLLQDGKEGTKMQKILIVEDDEKLRNELAIFLNKNGYQAKVLETFNNTIQDILTIKPDLILLDINLPRKRWRVYLQRN